MNKVKLNFTCALLIIVTVHCCRNVHLSFSCIISLIRKYFLLNAGKYTVSHLNWFAFNDPRSILAVYGSVKIAKRKKKKICKSGRRPSLVFGKFDGKSILILFACKSASYVLIMKIPFKLQTFNGWKKAALWKTGKLSNPLKLLFPASKRIFQFNLLSSTFRIFFFFFPKY